MTWATVIIATQLVTALVGISLAMTYVYRAPSRPRLFQITAVVLACVFLGSIASASVYSKRLLASASAERDDPPRQIHTLNSAINLAPNDSAILYARAQAFKKLH